MAEISTEDGRDIIATAHEMADAAGAAILPFFRSGALHEESKLENGYDPVTAADRAAEAAMREVLARRRPDDAVLGEELGTTGGRSGLTWVLDPIDGTRSFVSGTPVWGVLIGLSDETGVRFGMIDQPYTRERFWGGFDEAEFRGPHEGSLGMRQLSTRNTADLSDAILFSTFPEVGTPEEGAAFREVAERVKLVRYGTDCYAYALIALGQIDLVIEAGLHPYDVQGPIGVIEAAGGIVTDWTGGPAHQGGRLLAAANPRLHAQALDILATQVSAHEGS